MSTLVKQMQIAYAPETITATEQEGVRAELFVNLVTAFHVTLEMVIEYGWQHESDVLFKIRAISFGDLLRVRTKTRYITEKLFETRSFVYQVIDVDGTRPARRDWVHTWEGADCLFFVASLAGYNRCVVEDTSANQMQESLQLFKTLLSLELLKATAIVLILNKLDIFKNQIQKHPLKTWYPDFVGREKDYEAALSYIVAEYKATKSPHDKREIQVYYTDATNIETCQATLRDIEDNVMPRIPKIH
ncbi:MAG: hypothetical protein L6R42_006544 [Xanthoria sp. 1 TBL-2021]|nr:MAG: hypothetical protein L6R42_006544 [Xanthoria sp. 1 TBL-2021]